MEIAFHDCPELLKQFLYYLRTVRNRSPKTVDAYYVDIRTFFRYLMVQHHLVSEKVEFKEILNKNDIQDLTETETAYFGERIQRSCPHELQFDRDSLSIVKTNNIVEKYKLKWQDKKLFIYQKPIDKWEYCGEKDENGRVILNIGFYIIKNNNDQRTFMAIGQEYNLISYSELMNQDFLSIIWLKRKYTFE